MSATFSNKLCQAKKKSKLIILAVLRRSVLRVAGPISAAQRQGNTAAKKRHSGGELMAS